MIGQVLDRYRIEAKLGEGGMGVVYRARDTRLDRTVAIKVLPPEKIADPERKQCFVQEAKAASALNHPQIVTVHDIRSDGGVDFIVMEYAGGGWNAALLHGEHAYEHARNAVARSGRRRRRREDDRRRQLHEFRRGQDSSVNDSMLVDNFR